ncbi:N-glycosidase [Abditibacteriota bacterium]|nr:N-glycosidase [Abditibacteriota bacterium]
MAIYFYSKSERYFEFSNFSSHGVELNGAWWPTVEHFFQAQKFEDKDYRDRIRRARTPKDAKELGRTRALAILADWDTRRDEVMLEAVRKKFATHAAIRELLLSTGDEELIENAPTDYYWGCGRTGTGQNKLGQILMQVREELRQQPG